MPGLRPTDEIYEHISSMLKQKGAIDRQSSKAMNRDDWIINAIELLLRIELQKIETR